MRYFTDIKTFSDGSKLAVGKPGITYKASPLTLWAFCQSGVVMRLTKSVSSPAAVADIAVTSSGGDAVTIHYSFAFGDTIYADITDVVRTMVLRALPGALSQVGTTLTSIVVEMFEGDGTSVDSVTAAVQAIDGIDYAYEMPDTPQWPGLPDRVRLYTSTPLTFAVCGSDGFATVTPKYNATAITIDNAGQGATFSANPPGVFQVVDDGVAVTTCKVEQVDCITDKVILRWWSPELGGWKSSVWDVVEQGQDVDRVTTFDRLFTRNAASDASLWVRVRVPLCSVRDWLWLRDIEFSDEVELYAAEKNSVGGTFDMWRSVTVSPASSSWKVSDVKDFDIVIATAEASSL